MDAATLAAICLLHARNPTAHPSPSPPAACPVNEATAARTRLGPSRAVVVAPQALDALARTVVAEAGDQGDSGMAGVVYAILNRLIDGRWGASVEAVVDAPGQFEPVMRAGGSWRGLRPASARQQARVETIVNLALDGRLPDPTVGARYFQNPRIVAARAQAGEVSAALVNFGGAAPSAVIGAHAFYVGRTPRSGVPPLLHRVATTPVAPRSGGDIFVGENRVSSLIQPRVQAASNGGEKEDGSVFVP